MVPVSLDAGQPSRGRQGNAAASASVAAHRVRAAVVF